MNPQHDIYFIAIIPPPALSAEIRSIQEDFAVRFHTKKALHVVPHITLLPPFRINKADSQNLIDWFRVSRFDVKSFDLSLHGFAAFQNKKQPVIYLEPASNAELVLLHQQIRYDFYASFPHLPDGANQSSFTPHLTIAYRDLTQTRFKLAWADYQSRDFKATFKVDRYYLLKYTGKAWEINLSARL